MAQDATTSVKKQKNSVTIWIPAPLRAYVNNQKKVQIEGATVGEALHRLVTEYPLLKKHLFKEDGSLRNFVNIYLNEKDIRSLNRLETPLAEGDELQIIPSIAGGGME